MYPYDKHPDPVSVKNLDETRVKRPAGPPGPPTERPPQPPPDGPPGHLAGTYRRDGFTLTRERDGLTLAVCFNPLPRSPRHSDRFLVCTSQAGRPRVGFLYRSHGLDGAEFDDARLPGRIGPPCRYRIEQLSETRFRFRVLYVKGSNRGTSTRRGQA